MLIERYQIATVIALMIYVFSFSLSIITIEGNGIWLSQTIYNYTLPLQILDPSTPIAQILVKTNHFHIIEDRIIYRHSEKYNKKVQEWGNFTIYYGINEIVMKRVDKVIYPHKKAFHCLYDSSYLENKDCGPMNKITIQIINTVVTSSLVFIYYTLICVLIQMILFGINICIKNGSLLSYWNIRFRYLFSISTVLSYISPILFTINFPKSIVDPNIIVFSENYITNTILSSKYRIGPNLQIQYLIAVLTSFALIIILYSIVLYNKRNKNLKNKSYKTIINNKYDNNNNNNTNIDNN